MASHDYLDLLERLYTANLDGKTKCGLESMLFLSKKFGFPEKQFQTIHVGGSNGKGSVSTKIAKAYALEGKKVGLYTSPHISTFRERIQINSELISESSVVSLLTKIYAKLDQEKMKSTFFEIATLLAFCYFAEQQVDIAVIEVGLGGRLDSTNIITPILSTITSLSLEHTAILGKTLPDIAKEKAGIIKPHIPIVLGPQVPPDLFLTTANKLQSPCIQVKGHFNTFDAENSATAKACLEYLKVSESAIEKGCKALPPCRMELISLPSSFKKIPQAVILDVAHNPDGLEKLFKGLIVNYPTAKFRIVCGFSRNKEIKECVKVLRKYSTFFHLIEANHPRALSVKDIQQEFIQQGTPNEHLVLHESLESNVKKAIEIAADQEEVLLICGSFFIMQSVRKLFSIHEPVD